MRLCNALKRNGQRCTITKNVESYFYNNKNIYLCKIHSKVLSNNKLNIYEEKENNNSIIKKVEELKNNLQKLNINDDIYDNFCGKTNIDNLIKSLRIYKNILITGPSGVGKSLSIELLFNNNNYDVIYYKGEELFKFTENNNNKSVKNKVKVIIFDNLEELNIKEINQIFKTNILNKNNIIIFICNDSNINSNDLKMIKNYCYNVKFVTPNINDISQYIKKLCSKNKINLNNNKINELILSKRNDIRSITNDILFYKNNVENIDIYKKDIKLDIFDAFKEIMKKIQIKDKIEIFEQNDYLDLMLHENYCNKKYVDINEIKKISDDLSLYDTLNCNEVCNTYEITKYKALVFQNIKYQRLKFSSYFSNESKRKRKYEHVKEEYYNYKKRYTNIKLSLQDFINYKEMIIIEN